MELTFAAPSWADTSPIDPRTYRVVSDAFRIVVDKDGRLDALLSAVRRQARQGVRPLPAKRGPIPFGASSIGASRGLDRRQMARTRP